jgi:GTPase SAR1 family protein
MVGGDRDGLAPERVPSAGGESVKIAFAGKGGSGKTTLSSLFVRHLAAQGLPVVAVDADINQHLAEALGADREPPAMGAHLTEIKDYLRGSNPRISSAAAMVKTTPPGPGSRLLRRPRPRARPVRRHPVRGADAPIVTSSSLAWLRSRADLNPMNICAKGLGSWLSSQAECGRGGRVAGRGG